MSSTAYIRPSHHRPKRLKRGAPAAKSYWEVRQKGIMFLPAGTLGFSSLITPDTYEGKIKFKLNLHLTQSQAEALADKLQNEVINPAFDKLKEESGKDLSKKSAAAWLEEALKEPKEKARIQLPMLGISCNADIKNRDGDITRQSVKAWDAKGTLLDMPSLHMGMGSIISVGVSAALWHGSLAVEKDAKKKPIKWWALPSLRLVGVRVLKLEQFGAGNTEVGEVSEEDLVGVEEGFEAEDLASFARQAEKPTPKAAPEEVDTGITTDGPVEF